MVWQTTEHLPGDARACLRKDWETNLRTERVWWTTRSSLPHKKGFICAKNVDFLRNTPIESRASVKLMPLAKAHAPRNTSFVELYSGSLRVTKPKGCDGDHLNNSHNESLRSIGELRKNDEITKLPRCECFRHSRLMCLNRSEVRRQQSMVDREAPRKIAPS